MVTMVVWLLVEVGGSDGSGDSMVVAAELLTLCQAVF